MDSGLVKPYPKIVIAFTRPMRSYMVKDNQLGSAVIEIHWYTQTDRHPVVLYIYWEVPDVNPDIPVNQIPGKLFLNLKF